MRGLMTQKTRKTVLITGASTGIGKACALRLAKSGYRVFAGIRDPSTILSVKQEDLNDLLPIPLDVTNIAHVESALELVRETLGSDDGLTGLVNNAGVCLPGPTEFLPVDVLRRQLEVNVVGQIAITQAFLPLIRKAKGRIINIGSGTGRFALPFFGAYSASKSAMEALTDALRRELRPWGISVSIIEPGTVETPMWTKTVDAIEKIKATLPLSASVLYGDATCAMAEVMEKGRRRSISPEVIARVVHDALETRRPRSRYLVGAGARMAAIAGFIPDSITDWVIEKVLSKKIPTKVLGW